MSINTTGYKNLITAFYLIMTNARRIARVSLAEDKWTLSEMVGHLIDSASNNHQRFIRLQLDTNLTFPAYEAEAWKGVSKAGMYDYQELIDFWKHYNLFLLHLISQIEEKSLSNYWQHGSEKETLQFLVEDYFRHIQWHVDLFNERVAEITRNQ